MAVWAVEKSKSSSAGQGRACTPTVFIIITCLFIHQSVYPGFLALYHCIPISVCVANDFSCLLCICPPWAPSNRPSSDVW